MTDDLVPLSSVDGPLALVKESWRHRDYRLVGPHGELVGVLEYSLGNAAIGRASDGVWHFSRLYGLAHFFVTATSEESDETPLAQIDGDTWRHGGAVTLNGKTYDVAGEGTYHPHWSLKQDGVEHLSVEQAAISGEHRALVTISETGRADPSTLLLALLMLHAMLAYQQGGQDLGAGLVSGH
jgi:hypothetical protein